MAWRASYLEEERVKGCWFKYRPRPVLKPHPLCAPSYRGEHARSAPCTASHRRRQDSEDKAGGKAGQAAGQGRWRSGLASRMAAAQQRQQPPLPPGRCLKIISAAHQTCSPTAMSLVATRNLPCSAVSQTLTLSASTGVVHFDLGRLSCLKLSFSFGTVFCRFERVVFRASSLSSGTTPYNDEKL